jgi:transposase
VEKVQAVEPLGRTRRVVNRYIERFLSQGDEGLKDKRGGNYRKLTEKDERKIVQC